MYIRIVLGFVPTFFYFKVYRLKWCRNIIQLVYIPGFLKTGLAKISTHSSTWQFKTIKLIQRPIKSLHLKPGSKLMVPRSIPTTQNLK